MTGTQDEPAALAFMLDEAGLQPGGRTAEEVANAVCHHGRMGSLQLLHERSWLVPQHLGAAQLLRDCGLGGHPAVATWLLNNVCGGGPGQHPYTAELFAAAAQLGSVPLLQQLRERGCPWDPSVWQAAVYSGCAALLQWLHDEGCPRPVSSGALCAGAGTACTCARTWACGKRFTS